MLTSKFVRAHFISPTLTATVANRWLFKLLYEFWGFCVNGGDSLTAPGGFASSGSVPVLSGAVVFPAGFESGSTVLLASGSDGTTDAGMPFFNVTNPIFSSSYVGKHLVTWKSGSTSTDDSVYEITQWLNSSSLRVKVYQGGTPYSSSLHPAFTQRTQVKYRVIDFNAAANLAGYTTNDRLVLQFNGAGLINTGQLNSQCRLRSATTPSVGITISPSGSWTPASASFTDSTTEFAPTWTFAGPGYVSLWGAQDYIICHAKGNASAEPMWFHVEIPARLYPQPLDPNVIAFISATDTPDMTNYEGGVASPSPIDGVQRNWPMLVRSPVGANWHITMFPSPYAMRTLANGRWNNMWFNVFTNKFTLVDGVLALTSVSQQYCLARARMRRVRFTVLIIPQMQRLGDNGEWLFTEFGILWPWDNALLPYSLFLGGN